MYIYEHSAVSNVIINMSEKLLVKIMSN